MSTLTPQDLVPAVRSGKLSAVVARLDAAGESVKPTDLGIGLAMASFLGYRDIVRELVRRGALLNLPPGLTDVSALAMAVRGKQNKTTRMLIALGAKIPPGMDTGLTQEELEEAQTLARRRAAKHKKSHRSEPTIAEKPPKQAVPPPPLAATPHLRAPAVQPAPTPPPVRPPAPGIVQPAKTSPPPAPKNELPSLDFTFPTQAESESIRQPAAQPPAKPVVAATPPAARMSRGGVVEEIEMVACYGVDTNVLESDLGRWHSGAAEHEQAHEEESLNAPELDLGKNSGSRKR